MKVSLKDPRTSAAIFVVMLAVCFAANLAPSRENAIVSAAVTTPFAPTPSLMDCDIDCGEGDFFGCDPGQHQAWDTVPAFQAWTRNGGVHQDDCWPYTCDVRHGPFCGYQNSPEALEALRVLVRAHDVRGLAASIIEHPEAIRLNTRRSAVQVLNCKGNVVFHMPLPSSFAKAVSLALQATDQ